MISRKNTFQSERNVATISTQAPESSIVICALCSCFAVVACQRPCLSTAYNLPLILDLHVICIHLHPQEYIHEAFKAARGWRERNEVNARTPVREETSTLNQAQCKITRRSPSSCEFRQFYRFY